MSLELLLKAKENTYCWMEMNPFTQSSSTELMRESIANASSSAVGVFGDGDGAVVVRVLWICGCRGEYRCRALERKWFGASSR